MLRALNDSRSAFTAFCFHPDFFEEYACGMPGQAGGDEGGGPESCKVMVKPLQHMLRGGVRRVLSLRIYLNEAASAREEGREGSSPGARRRKRSSAGSGPGAPSRRPLSAPEVDVEAQIVFEMECEWGVRKRHSFQLQDCEVVHAVFDRAGASCLRSHAHHLSQLFDHLHGSAEVALVAGRDGVCLRSWRGEEGGREGGLGEGPGEAFLSTEMTVKAEELDAYEVAEGGGDPEGGEVGVVFSLREVKAFLGFCEGTATSSVSFYFLEGGRPVLFVAGEGGMEGGMGQVELVLATVSPVLTEGSLQRGGGRCGGGGEEMRVIKEKETGDGQGVGKAGAEGVGGEGMGEVEGEVGKAGGPVAGDSGREERRGSEEEEG